MIGTQTMQITEHKTLGFRSDQRMKPLWAWLIVSLVILGSVRGIIVINSDLPVEAVYLPVAASLMILAIFGYMQRTGYRNADLILLRNLLKLNLMLGILNLAVEYFLGGLMDLGYIYLFIAPYIVFLFLRVPTRYLSVAVVIITIAISYSVCVNFVDSLSGPAGFEKVYEYNLRLRPETFKALSHTEGIYRAGGYTGSYHDAANILGMAVSFFFIRFLLGKNILDLGLFLFAMLSITLTQSAANIVVAAFTIVIFAGYLLYLRRNVATYVYLLLGVAAVTALIAVVGDAISVFTMRLGKDADWQGMLGFLDVNIMSEIPFILVGHGLAFNAQVTATEIAHLIVVGQLGIFHAVILFWIMLYPLFRLAKLRPICLDALPPAAAVFFGFMSMLHYNSVSRVTSIFLFFALYAMCLNSIINWRNAMQLAQPSARDRGLGEKPKLSPT